MHAEDFLYEAAHIAEMINPEEVERMAEALSKIEGRVYMVGLGGSLANCIHMAADLKKLCKIDAVSPDNIAELTAWANDDHWDSLFLGYLWNITDKDALFVLSVGGGTNTVSRPITIAIELAQTARAKIFGIVGPKGGFTADDGDYVIKIPVENPEHVTPHTEAFQMVLCHCLVSHPLLQKRACKW